MKMMMIFGLFLSLNVFAGDFEIDCITENNEIQVAAKISGDTGKVVNGLNLTAFGEKVPVRNSQLLRTFSYNGEFILVALNSDRSEALVFLNVIQQDDTQIYEGTLDYKNSETYNVRCQFQ